MQTIPATDNDSARANGGGGRTAMATNDRGAVWRVLSILAVVIAVAALVVSATKDTSSSSATHDLVSGLAAKADRGAYQAVTLSNGTVYYGHLSTEGDSLVLNDVYYLTGATTENPSGSLVKRGGEVFSPKGALVLNPSLVLEVDNVGSDSVVVRGINALAKKGK